MRALLRVALLLPLLLVACGDSSKSELIGKAKGADTKAKLESALGRPDDLTKVGPLEKWTYKASDGEVTFLITGESVALELAGGSSQ
jgi:hypothetical protein